MRMTQLLPAAAIAAAFLGGAPVVAQVARVEILGRESPALGGKSFGEVGRYEKIEGRIHGEVDPSDPRNQIITDLELAPRNSAGKVEYAADFVLLKPMDMTRAGGILRYVAPNRGGAAVVADPLFLARGEVFLWGAWQGDVPKGGRRLALDVPVARNRDGSPITGTVRVEFVGRRGSKPAEMPLEGNAYNQGQIPYPPASLDNSTAILTKRRNEGDPRIFIPRSDWAFAASDTSDNPFPGKPDPAKVSLKGGFSSEYLYELVYTAKDPKVMGLGLAALRDMVAFFRRDGKDAAGTPNPLGSHIKYAIGTGVSQSGNFMKTFVHLGFNEDQEGKRLFDALFPIVAARQTHINARFALPGGGGGLRGASSVRPGVGTRLRSRLSRRGSRQYRRHFQAERGDENHPQDVPCPERHGVVGPARLPGPHGRLRDQRPGPARQPSHLLFRRHPALHAPSGVGPIDHGLSGRSAIRVRRHPPRPLGAA